MFLNSYLKSKNNDKILIDNLYLKIVNISRDKVFYKKLSVPDTLDGRFDLLVLYSVITIYFLTNLDLDLTLRELGAGDAGVHIKIKNMVNSFMGRQKIYCKCFETNDYDLLKEVLIKNVYRNVKFFNDSPDHLTNYCKRIYESFNNKKGDFFLQNKLKFPKFE